MGGNVVLVVCKHNDVLLPLQSTEPVIIPRHETVLQVRLPMTITIPLHDKSVSGHVMEQTAEPMPAVVILIQVPPSSEPVIIPHHETVPLVILLMIMVTPLPDRPVLGLVSA